MQTLSRATLPHIFLSFPIKLLNIYQGKPLNWFVRPPRSLITCVCDCSFLLFDCLFSKVTGESPRGIWGLIERNKKKHVSLFLITLRLILCRTSSDKTEQYQENRCCEQRKLLFSYGCFVDAQLSWEKFKEICCSLKAVLVTGELEGSRLLYTLIFTEFKLRVGNKKQ